MKEDGGQRGAGRNVCLAPGVAGVVGEKDVTAFPHRYQPTLDGHPIQQKGAGGKRRLNRALQLLLRGGVSGTAGRNGAEKSETNEEDTQWPQGEGHP